VELFGNLELQQMLNQFFDRAVNYGILWDAAARDQDHVMKDSVQVGGPIEDLALGGRFAPT
jgi:hypothetical protein